MTELLYLNDSYLRECEAQIEKVEGKRVFVNRTVFYPQGGGQPSDTGKIVRASDGAEFKVDKVLKEQGEAAHYVDREGLVEGDSVKMILNWERRYKIMRMHTAAHILGAVVFERGVQITGNQLGDALTRFDFNVPSGLQRETIEAGVAKANELLCSGAEVKVLELPREEAMKITGVVKLAHKLPPI
ncbi:MAG: alanyl-tRNA editing protein [Candidatus Norongarragalinales archaeon]